MYVYMYFVAEHKIHTIHTNIWSYISLIDLVICINKVDKQKIYKQMLVLPVLYFCEGGKKISFEPWNKTLMLPAVSGQKYENKIGKHNTEGIIITRHCNQNWQLQQKVNTNEY